MSDKNGSDREPERKRPFIREKVAKPPRTKRQMVFRVFAYVILAAIAGIAAGTSFAVAGPIAERYLVPTTAAPTAPTVTIPTDTETVPAPANTGTRPGSANSGTVPGATVTGAASGNADGGNASGSMDAGAVPGNAGGGSASGSTDTGAAPGSAGGGSVPGSVDSGTAPGTANGGNAPGSNDTGTVPDSTDTVPETTEPPTSEKETETTEETKPIEEILESAIEEYDYTVDDLNSMYTALRGVAATADNGIVTIHSVRQELDWFDNPIENTGLYAGAIFAATEQELMILIPAAALEDADTLRVTFADGSEADCTVRQTDSLTGLAVVSVGLGDLEETAKTKVSALTLGNSFLTKQGDVVMAVGAPTGAVHSCAYGFISHIVRNVQVPDGVTRLLYADVAADAASGTFLINTAGELIGWATDDYESGSGIAVVRAISEYKSMLEKMSNGIPIPYLGIQPQEVSEAMQESGMPAGIYVLECSIEGPAYDAGIQSGDIIVRIGEMDVEKISEFQAQMAALKAGDQAAVVVQRKGADEYIELEYQVNVGAR